MVGITFLIVWVLGIVLWILSIGLAAERRTVRIADGTSYDVLVNPDGVMLFGKAAAWTNLYGGLPALGLVRRLRGRTGWVVRVRRHPFRGKPDLAHEVLPTRAEAHARMTVLANDLRQGRVGPGELP